MDRSTIITLPCVLEAALPFARGSYQRDLLLGRQRLSGADLRGKARRFADRYATSAANLMRRLNRAGIAAGERTGPHGLRQLVIGPRNVLPENS